MQGEENEQELLFKRGRKRKHKRAKFSISKSVVFAFLCYNDGKVENTLS